MLRGSLHRRRTTNAALSVDGTYADGLGSPRAPTRGPKIQGRQNRANVRADGAHVAISELLVRRDPHHYTCLFERAEGWVGRLLLKYQASVVYM
jgi:hypothetical protein